MLLFECLIHDKKPGLWTILTTVSLVIYLFMFSKILKFLRTARFQIFGIPMCVKGNISNLYHMLLPYSTNTLKEMFNVTDEETFPCIIQQFVWKVKIWENLGKYYRAICAILQKFHCHIRPGLGPSFSYHIWQWC